MSGKNRYLSEIEKTYQTIDNNFDKAFKECKTDRERKALISARDVARDTFWSAVASSLEHNTDNVKQQYDALKKANKDLKISIRQLKNIGTIINAMEEAVRLAAALAVAAA